MATHRGPGKDTPRASLISTSRTEIAPVRYATAVQRKIAAFREDDKGDFIAELDCGHGQHMRHKPPMTFRPWVLTEEGRAARVGADCECVLCDRAEMPRGYEEHRRTNVFDAASVPRALLREHRTKLGVWGKLLVHEGQLDFVALEPERRVTKLGAGDEHVIVSGLAHEVALHDGARFTVSFYGPPRRDSRGSTPAR